MIKKSTVCVLIFAALAINIVINVGFFLMRQPVQGSTTDDDLWAYWQRLTGNGEMALLVDPADDNGQFPRLLMQYGSCELWQIAPGVMQGRAEFVTMVCNNVCLNRKTMNATIAGMENMQSPTEFPGLHVNSLVHQFSGNFQWGFGQMHPQNLEGVETIPGTTWLVDIRHNKSATWANLCHWSDHVFTMVDAMVTVPELFRSKKLAFDQVAMWQFSQAQFSGDGVRWLKQTLEAAVGHNMLSIAGDEKRQVKYMYNDSTPEVACFERIVLNRNRMSSHFSNMESVEQFKQEFAEFFGYGKRPVEKKRIVFINRLNNRIIKNMEHLMESATEMFASVNVTDVEMEEVLLEGKTTSEQFELFANSGMIVAMHGAALTNAVVMPKGAVLVEIFPCGIYSTSYNRVARESGIQHYQIRQASDPKCLTNLGRTHMYKNFKLSDLDWQPNFMKAASYYAGYLKGVSGGDSSESD